MAERARRRRRGDLRPPPRTGAPAAERPPRALLPARALRLPPAFRWRARRTTEDAPGAELPAREAVGRASGDGADGGPLPHRVVGERNGAGDLRDGLSAGIPARPA